MDLDFLFDDENKCPKEQKRELKSLLLDIKKIEQRAGGKLLFDDNTVYGDNLLAKIRAIEKEFKNNSIQATAVQRSRRNHVEDSMINFIAKKDEMLEKVNLFVESFNKLDQKQRTVIYFSFFKNKQNEYIAQKLFVSEMSVRRLKEEATETLMTKIAIKMLMKQQKFDKSKSNDLGFLNAKGGK